MQPDIGIDVAHQRDQRLRCGEALPPVGFGHRRPAHPIDQIGPRLRAHPVENCQTQDALLANRRDLTADYVKAVVRGGKGAMPAQTRVDLTDAELNAVAAYLAQKGKK